MSHPPPFDPNIPILTEILQGARPAAVRPAAARPATGQGGPLEERAADGWGVQEWDMLEHRLSARILQQLQGRVDFVLEQGIRDSMSEVLQHALANLTEHIRSGLQDTLKKIVTHAVSQELTQMQALKK